MCKVKDHLTAAQELVRKIPFEKIVTLADDQQSYSTQDGLAKFNYLLRSFSVDVVMGILEANAYVPPHSHSVKEYFICHSGTLVVNHAGKSIALTAGECYYVDVDEEHYSTTEQGASVVIVRIPGLGAKHG